jgi:hypothetical protein
MSKTLRQKEKNTDVLTYVGYICIMYLRRIIANGYGLDGPGIESRGCEVFRARPHLPRGPPSLLYNGYWVSFLGVKWPGCGADHTPPPPSSSAEVLNGLELYLRLPFLPE